MSYLEAPRIAFAGEFQADVSTVNNDVRHFDNSTFEARFQEPQTTNQAGQTIMNGWWNPDGTGAFRLVGVRVASAETAEGAQPGDAAVGVFVKAQFERVAAKLVDLDPQFQMGSEIWGLRVLLSDGENELMRGDFRPAAFRDLFFGRVNGAGGSGMASAKFTSVLDNLAWSEHAAGSPTLAALKEAAAANGGRLSISLTVYGYRTGAGDAAFTYGNVVGAIGPWAEGEPESFVLGRRFAPDNPANPFATPDGVGFFDAVLARHAYLDLGDSLPLASRDSAMNDVGALSLVVLKQPDRIEGKGDQRKVTPGIVAGATVTPDDYIEIGDFDYRRPGWLQETAGIVTLPLPAAAADAARDRPLAIVARDETTGARKVLIRETYGGLFVRADDFIKRVDARFDGLVSDSVSLYAAQYGARAADTSVSLSLDPPENGAGGGPSGAVDPPQAPIPTIGIPPDAVRFPGAVQTGADGVAQLPIQALDPGNPRGYIDGQIYKVNYAFGLDGESALPLWDQIVLHVRDAFVAPPMPDWDNGIAAVLRQYGNLYPIMSKGLFSFSDPAVVEAHARLLHFAFTRPIEDPNHMPVTRDLSAAKRDMIVAWLATFFEAAPALAARPAALAAAETLPPAPVGAPRGLSREAAATLERLIEEEGIGKSEPLRAFLDAHRSEPG